MNVPINFLAVLAAAVAAMAIGSAWYAQFALGKKWMKLVGITPESAKKGAVPALVGMFVAALLTAYILAHFIEIAIASPYFTDTSSLMQGLSTAFWAWLGLVVTTLISGPLFAKTSWHLFFINAGNQFVTLLAMGAILGYWR
jgi:hypothetical protein